MWKTKNKSSTITRKKSVSFKAIIYVIKMAISKSGTLGLWLLFFLFLSTLTEILYGILGFTPSLLIAIIIRHQYHEAWKLIFQLIRSVLLVALLKGVKEWVNGKSALRLRSVLNDTLVNVYTNDEDAFAVLPRYSPLYYSLNNHDTSLSPSIDNPDERIAIEPQKYSILFFGLLDKLFLAPFLIVYYGWYTWKKLGGQSCFIIMVFFLVGAFSQRLLLPFVVQKRREVEQSEANYRSILVQVEDYKESIALARNTALLRNNLQHSFHTDILPLRYSLCLLESIQCFLGQLFAYTGAVLNYYLIITSLLQTKEVKEPSLGNLDDSMQNDAEIATMISATSFTTLYLIHQLSGLLECSGDLSKLMASAGRIAELLKITIKEETNIDKNIIDNNNMIESISNGKSLSPINPYTLLEIRNVNVITPDGRLLIKGLFFSISSHETDELQNHHLHITGPNGSGKTSIARILMGLWRIQVDHQSDSKNNGIFYNKAITSVTCIPQRSCFLNGSLHDQLGNTSASLDTINSIFQMLRLNGLLTHCRGLYNHLSSTQWRKHLTPGEQQKLVIARLLLNPPNIAILDEATNALDEGMEEIIYEALIKKGIRLISIGHKCPTPLQRIPHQVLTLTKGEIDRGHWTLTNSYYDVLI